MTMPAKKWASAYCTLIIPLYDIICEKLLWL
jgi:hypothetical protein